MIKLDETDTETRYPALKPVHLRHHAWWARVVVKAADGSHGVEGGSPAHAPSVFARSEQSQGLAGAHQGAGEKISRSRPRGMAGWDRVCIPWLRITRGILAEGVLARVRGGGGARSVVKLIFP